MAAVSTHHQTLVEKLACETETNAGDATSHAGRLSRLPVSRG
jgi:hypothetical protein